MQYWMVGKLRTTATGYQLQAALNPRPDAERVHADAEQVGWDETPLPGSQSDHAHDYAIHACNGKASPSLAPDQNRRQNRKTTRQII
jgi:hypothetical protein